MRDDYESTEDKGARRLAEEAGDVVYVNRPCADCGLVIAVHYTQGRARCEDRKACRARAAEAGSPEVARVDGHMLCPDCSRPYSDHPWDEVNLSYDGDPFLHIGCDERRLKT